MSQYTDQLGNSIHLNKIPKRIISLVPSQTELLYDLGLDEEVIGITKFCIHPESWFRCKTRIGGTKTIDVEKIKQLQPDLIIANKEENVKEQIEALQQIAPVWVSDVNNLDEALNMIASIGEMIERSPKADELINSITSGFNQLPTINQQLSTAYLIWKDPYMTVGGDTFINDMLQRCGFKNKFQHLERYPEISVEQLKDCELVLLSSEPYPFKQKHIDEIKTQLTSSKSQNVNLKFLLVDGEMFSWYGSRLQFAAKYFMELISKC